MSARTQREKELALALAVATLALIRISDPDETSLRQRTGGGEKPNCRVVADEALDAIADTIRRS